MRGSSTFLSQTEECDWLTSCFSICELYKPPPGVPLRFGTSKNTRRCHRGPGPKPAPLQRHRPISGGPYLCRIRVYPAWSCIWSWQGHSWESSRVTPSLLNVSSCPPPVPTLHSPPPATHSSASGGITKLLLSRLSFASFLQFCVPQEPMTPQDRTNWMWIRSRSRSLVSSVEVNFGKLPAGFSLPCPLYFCSSSHFFCPFFSSHTGL